MRVVVGRDVQVLSASRPELIPVSPGYRLASSALVAVVARRGGPAVADGRPGRQWCLRLPGAAGGDLLPNQPDDAAGGAAVRGPAGSGTPDHRPAQPAS